MLGPILLFAGELPPGKPPLADETLALRDGKSKIIAMVVPLRISKKKKLPSPAHLAVVDHGDNFGFAVTKRERFIR